MSQKTALQRLLDEPKGKKTYKPNQAFLLHVFWEAPNLSAAERILNALQRCADATHRDTPCVPTYYFRISSLEADLVSTAPKTIGQHPQIAAARKKLDVGVPKPAVVADLIRRGLDPTLLDLEPEQPLPPFMEAQATPVMLECTEIYLDERAFFEHAGSRDYLAAYGEVMLPGLQNSQVTIRLGTPTADIVDKILVPMLRENAEPMAAGYHLWNWPRGTAAPAAGLEPKPSTSSSRIGSAAGFLIAMNLHDITDASEIVDKLPDQLKRLSTTCVGFAHPLRTNTTRVLCVVPESTMGESFWKELSVLPLAGLEIHCDDVLRSSILEAVDQAGFACACTVKSVQTGYLVHRMSHSVCEEVHEVTGPLETSM